MTSPPRLTDQARFDRLCAFARGPVGVAVSGGSDSLALLYRAKAWVATTGRPLLALTVDHGLRAESAREARCVADICADLGVPHETLVWTHPVKRQSAARRARHSLLANALRAAGGTHLLLGHTADDQCETVMMRLRQGSTWYGLAGMQPSALSPVWPEGAGIVIARPLLHERRATLRDALRQKSIVWVEDPSNADHNYERIRMRALLQSDARLMERISALYHRFSILRGVEDGLIGRWMRDRTGVEDGRRIWADLAGLPVERAGRALNNLLQIVAGRDVPPRREGLMALAAQLLADAPFTGATLGGVWVKRKQGRVLLQAEPAVADAHPGPDAMLTRYRAVKDLFLGQL